MQPGSGTQEPREIKLVNGCVIYRVSETHADMGTHMPLPVYTHTEAQMCTQTPVCAQIPGSTLVCTGRYTQPFSRSF